jgi:hypothetical protein
LDYVEPLWGIIGAIISIVNTWTVSLAVFVVVAHCIVIFWPRKPLNVPLDDNGQPMLWRNETDQKKNVACVWWDDVEETTTASARQRASAGPLPVSSFSEAVRPLGSEVAQNQRSVA